MFVFDNILTLKNLIRITVHEVLLYFQDKINSQQVRIDELIVCNLYNCVKVIVTLNVLVRYRLIKS